MAASHRSDILHGPFPAGLGIPGVLHGGDAVAMTQVHEQFEAFHTTSDQVELAAPAVTISDPKGGVLRRIVYRPERTR